MSETYEALQKEMYELQKRLSEARRSQEPESVEDYALFGPNGAVQLSELFGDKDDLIVVHNMGKSCTYCTLWADGFTGVLDHLENRASFVLVSPDNPATQAEFASGRGWNFRMISDESSEFTRAMGYIKDHEGEDHWWPGMSAFHRNEDGTIVRTGQDVFGPGDNYNAPWHMFDHLAGGADGWQPKYSYEG